MLDLGMGKYMKKSAASEVSVMEDPHRKTSSVFVGVLTRAKTLALEKLGLLPAPDDGASYLQLRSRRLQRNVLPKKQNNNKSRGPTRRSPQGGAAVNGPGGVGSGQLIQEEPMNVGSAGGNALIVQQNGREQREATPPFLQRDPNVIRTPGSRTRPANSTEDNGTVHDPVRPIMCPWADELDAFLSKSAKLQQKQFMEKYNFDPVNEKPLPGRYEWEKVDP